MLATRALFTFWNSPVSRDDRVEPSRLAIGESATLRTDQQFAVADGLFGELLTPASPKSSRRIDRSIVAEPEQTADRPNSFLKSRAQFFDGSVGQFFVAHRNDLH